MSFNLIFEPFPGIMDPVVSLPMPRSPDQPHKMAGTRWESEAEHNQKVNLSFFVFQIYLTDTFCSEARQRGEPACTELQHNLPRVERGDGSQPGQLPEVEVGLVLLGLVLELKGLDQHGDHGPLLGVGAQVAHPHPAQLAEGGLLPRHPAQGTQRPENGSPLRILFWLPDSRPPNLPAELPCHQGGGQLGA